MICASQFFEGGFHGQGYQSRAPSLRGRDFETDKADSRVLEGPEVACCFDCHRRFPCPALEIARHTGLAEQTIHNLISSYNRFRPQALEGPGKGNRGRAYLSLEQEAEFLKLYSSNEPLGRIATARELHRALEKRLGCSAHVTSVLFFRTISPLDGLDMNKSSFFPLI